MNSNNLNNDNNNNSINNNNNNNRKLGRNKNTSNDGEFAIVIS